MEKVNDKKGFDLSLIIMMTSFFLLDAIMMFFFEPTFVYVAAMMAAIVLGTLLFFKLKPNLKDKKLNWLHGLIIVVSSMSLNIAVDITRVMYL